MIEIVCRKITVETQYVPTAWMTRVMFDEMERGVAQAILDGKVEVGIKDFVSTACHWFKLTDVPLDTRMEGHKALLSVEIAEQMEATRSLVSLEDVAI
jgi:hypothetical protein